MDDREEQNWAARARGGDRDAFARLVERYWGRVYRWLHGLTMRRHLAEDLTQEVFLRAWSALPQLRQEVRFRAWLFRIARNCLTNSRRDPRSAPPGPLPEASADRQPGPEAIVLALDGNGIELTYIKQSGESNGDAGYQYIGLDRFGRVVDQRWIPTSSPSTPTDRFQYGYDQDGNVLYKNNLVNSSFSELYHANSSSSGDDNTAYDNLNRLQAFRRGTLSASSNNGGVLDTVATLNTLSDSSQSYTLDAVGNMTSVTTDGTNQTNTVNEDDYIIADRCGTVFVLAGRIEAVLDPSERIVRRQDGMVAAVRAGRSVADVMHDKEFEAIVRG